jgi:hypothetical protein
MALEMITVNQLFACSKHLSNANTDDISKE